MRRPLLIAVVCAFGFSSADFVFAGADPLRLTVKAGKHDRVNTPVTVLIDAPADAKSALLTDASGTEIPGQLTAPGLKNAAAQGQSELHFVLPALKKGQSLELTAQFSAEAPGKRFAWVEKADQYAELSYDDRPVMRYMCLKLTDENREEAYKVYHHLYDPSGTRFVTKGPGSKYPHHRGIFFGYNKVTYDGGRANTWSGQNTPQVHGGYLAREAGPVLGRHLVQVDWRGMKGNVYLKEQRELAVYNVPAGALVEFTSRCSSTGGKIKLDGNSAHAGVQFRAAAEVAEKTDKQTYYLRPEGKGEMGQARNKAVGLPWDAISFVIDEKRYTVLYLDRPGNPRPAEYNERTYGRFGSFTPVEVEEGKDLDVNYRFWLQDGEMIVEQATALSSDFVDPPQVTVD